MDSTIFVLGRDALGTVAEDRSMTPPFRYYLTECCGASATGTADYVGCRSCYEPIDEALGDVPDREMRLTATGLDFVEVPLALVEVYGDGLAYDVWKARARKAAIEAHVEALLS